VGRRLAWTGTGVTVLAVSGAVVFGVANSADPGAKSYLVFVVSCAVAGGLVAGARPRNGLGWMLLGGALSFALLELCAEYAVFGAFTRPGAVPYPHLMAWPETWLWVPANLCVALVPLLFPDGRLTARRWWWLAGPFTAAAAVAAVLGALRPGPSGQLAAGQGVPNPAGVAGLGAAADVAGGVFTVGAGIVFVTGGIAVIARARGSDDAGRRQIKWVAWAAAVAGLVVVARLVAGLADADGGSPWPRGSLLWEYAGAVALSLVPAAVTVAVLRHRLYDIDVLINRTLVYTALSACLVGGYVLIAGYLGALVGRSGSLSVSVVAAAAVAVGFAPLRERIQHGINLMLYGRREEPYTVLARLGRRLEQAVTPAAVLPVIAETVAEALRLRYVAVEVAGGAAVTVGEPAGDAARLPLTYHGETVGALVLWPDPGATPLLADLARQVGVAVHAVRESERSARLSVDLQRSRERLVMAREEERRRLRRDLHDGLGPTLAALTMRAEAAQELAGDAAKDLLARVVDDAAAAVGDVRRLVEGLRPPALDTLGLAGAVRAHLAALPPGGPRVTLDTPETLPALPAATEVAAYRIVVEAVTNVHRHAPTANAVVALEVVDTRLTVRVTDTGPPMLGRGPSTTETDNKGPFLNGVGLVSMRERAAELGGTLVFETGAWGTRVSAELPAVAED